MTGALPISRLRCERRYGPRRLRGHERKEQDSEQPEAPSAMEKDVQHRRALLSVERCQVGDDVGSLLGILEAGEGHQRAGYGLLRVGEIAVQRHRIPGQTGTQIGLRVMTVRNASGVATNDAKEAGPDDIAARLR